MDAKLDRDARAIPEIREAVALLERYEAAPLSHESAQDFALALETLDDYLSENTDSPHRPFIENLRFSYTRRMLQRLSSISKADAYLSLQHIVLILHTVKTEAEDLMRQHPELQKDFDRLTKAWGEPLIRALLEDDANAPDRAK